MTDEMELADFCDWVERKYGQRIRAYIRWHFPGLSKEDGDDVCQDVMQGLVARWRDKPSFRKEQELGGLATTIAYNKACDLLRKREKTVIAAQNKAEQDSRNSHPVYPFDSLEREEIALLITEACRLLTEEERHVWRTYAENYPRSSMKTRLAEYCGMPGKSYRVSQVLVAARRKILRYLNDKGYDLDGIGN